MKEIKTAWALFRYSRIKDWPLLGLFFALKFLRVERRFKLTLRDYEWTASTTKPSGLHFFNEVIIHECYSSIRADIRNIKSPLIIDGGANCGSFALWALSINPGAHIISFEPGEAFESLSLNQKLYSRKHGDNWEIQKCALSSSVGMGSVEQIDNSSMGRFIEGGSNPVRCRTIDDLNQEIQILKIDVEGFEVEVLKGSEKTLSTAKLVILEYHSNDLRRQCQEFLLSHGFQLKEDGYLLIGYR